MSNVRRQTLIIAVLIVLIACAGWFAKKYTDTSTTTAGKDPGVTDTSGKQNQEASAFFSETRISRQSERSSTMDKLQNIIQSTSESAETKTDASSKYMALITRGDQENEVELKAKNEGYSDALCFIRDTGVELYIKVSENITADQAFVLQEIIVRTTGIAPSNIVVKPIEE